MAHTSSTDTELHNRRPNKHMSWLPPDPRGEVGNCSPYSNTVTILQKIEMCHRDLHNRQADWVSDTFQAYVIQAVEEAGHCPYDVFKYVYDKKDEPGIFQGLLERLVLVNYRFVGKHGWFSRGVLVDAFQTVMYHSLIQFKKLPGAFSSLLAQDLPDRSTVEHTGDVPTHCALMITTIDGGIQFATPTFPATRCPPARRRHVKVSHVGDKLYLNGVQQTTNGRHVLWSSKVSDTRFVYIESIYTFSRGARKSSRGAATPPQLTEMQIIMMETTDDSTAMNYTRLLNNAEMVGHVKTYADKGQTPPMAAITKDDIVIFILNLGPLRTVTYDLNDTVTMPDDTVVQKGAFSQQNYKYPLFAELEATLPDVNMEFLPQGSTINISDKRVLCGRLVISSRSNDQDPCHPNRFLERFCGQQVIRQEQRGVVSTSLQFFYEINISSTLTATCTIGGVSSAFHPCILDERPPRNTDDTFDRKYSAHQYVVGLERGATGREQTLMFWRGKNKDTPLQVQIFDNKIILAMIRPGRTARNFSMHANYIRCLKPCLVGEATAGLNMYGHARKHESFKHAFNPSLGLIKGGKSLMVVMRHTEDVVKWTKANTLVAEMVDFGEGGYSVRHQTVIDAGSARVVNTAPGEHNGVRKLEKGIVDPRLLDVNGELYILFNSLLSESEAHGETRLRASTSPPSGKSRLYMRKLTSDFLKSTPDDKDFAMPFCHLNARSDEEKNWSPFVDTDGKVSFIYSISPLAIYEVEDDASQEPRTYENCVRKQSIDLPYPLLHALKQSNLSLRGGSGGIAYGDDFLFVGHAFQSNPDPESKFIRPCFPDYIVGEAVYTGVNETRNQHYDGMYWVFFYVMGKDKTAWVPSPNDASVDEKEYWRVKQISMCSQLPGRTSPYPKIAFPTGLVAVDGGYNVAFGEWDSSCVLTFVSEQFMKAILKPVEVLDVQSYVTDCALFESLLLDYTGVAVPTDVDGDSYVGKGNGKGKRKMM